MLSTRLSWYEKTRFLSRYITLPSSYPTQPLHPHPHKVESCWSRLVKKKTLRDILIAGGVTPSKISSSPSRSGRTGRDGETTRTFYSYFLSTVSLPGLPGESPGPNSSWIKQKLPFFGYLYCRICLESEESIVKLFGLILFLAKCDRPCLNGGFCISPNHCQCQPGYRGDVCERGLWWF